MDQFGALWSRHPGGDRTDPELSLYHSAWEIAWGPTAGVPAARARLEAAKSDRALRVTAHRLQLFLSDALVDLGGYEAAFQQLRDLLNDRPLDHLRYWRLLCVTGRRGEAVNLARAYSSPPGSPAEARLMFDTFLQLGLRAYAAEFLGKHLPHFSFDSDLWLRQAEVLIVLERWDELRDLAVELRDRSHQSLGLTGYSWFIEGLSHQRRHRADSAHAAFQQIPQLPVNNVLLGYRMAHELSSLGEPKLAKEVLVSLERAAGTTADYWFHLVVAAYEAREFDTMLAAAEKAHQLAPDNPVNINNYAAALLMQRKNPALAAQLTLRKLLATPGDDGARINHALALLQNGRLDEARASLMQIDDHRLDRRLHTIFNLGLFELHFRENRPAEARVAYGQIEPRFLLAPQSRWLEDSHAQLGSAAVRPSGQSP